MTEVTNNNVEKESNTQTEDKDKIQQEETIWAVLNNQENTLGYLSYADADVEEIRDINCTLQLC